MIHDGYKNVLGLDVQADNVKLGKAWGAPIELGDAHSLDYPDRSLDAVFIRSALEHMFDPQKVIQEAWHVLRPGGIFFAVVPLEYCITDFEYAHSYAFDCSERLLELTWAFRNVYLISRRGKILYVGLKPGFIKKLICARLVSVRIIVGHRFTNWLRKMKVW